MKQDKDTKESTIYIYIYIWKEVQYHMEGSKTAISPGSLFLEAMVELLN